jgi:hypothetical protein
MSLRRTRAIPLHAHLTAGNPGRARLLPNSGILKARTPTPTTSTTTTRTICNSPIRLNSHAKNDPPISSVSSASAVDGAPEPNLSPEQVGELQSTDLLDVYNSLVARGLIVWDAEQVRCVMEVSPTLPSSAQHVYRSSISARVAIEMSL